MEMEEIDLLKIKDNIYYNISGIWYMDSLANGIYKIPTLYIWLYKDCRDSVLHL
jgi:hypothetical protein